MPHLLALMDDSHGRALHEHDQLESWSLSRAFKIIDVLGDSGLSFFVLATVKRMQAYASEEKNYAACQVLTNLADTFWHPETNKSFSNMVESQFNNPTVCYAILINFNCNGTFLSP
ncbi:hypothetical protein RhiXN_03498 [Rhizoctonia solani]|uniref:Uncharacterized protein n=1 Tax=Rhizoctonia solani TaxID=456999 RepID=A0A8H8NRI6_9AGAM|nr:uncharacterized protein RhiXN_03498 [Rhizoctonia solani]QRW18574.1 hypothetical protein RhiXN_03498 [Rhizoctonia solani]